MNNQTKTPRVETRRREIPEAALRRMLRPHGDSFGVFLREQAAYLADHCHQKPEPRQLAYDVAPHRGRSVTYETIGCAIVAAVMDPTLADGAIEIVTSRFGAWLKALRTDDGAPLLELYEAEAHAQADADAALAMAVLSLQTRDRVAVERGLEFVTVHLAQLTRLQVRLQAVLNDLNYAGGHRRFA